MINTATSDISTNQDTQNIDCLNLDYKSIDQHSAHNQKNKKVVEEYFEIEADEESRRKNGEKGDRMKDQFRSLSNIAQKRVSSSWLQSLSKQASDHERDDNNIDNLNIKTPDIQLQKFMFNDPTNKLLNDNNRKIKRKTRSDIREFIREENCNDYKMRSTYYYHDNFEIDRHQGGTGMQSVEENMEEFIEIKNYNKENIYMFNTEGQASNKNNDSNSTISISKPNKYPQRQNCEKMPNSNLQKIDQKNCENTDQSKQHQQQKQLKAFFDNNINTNPEKSIKSNRVICATQNFDRNDLSLTNEMTFSKLQMTNSNTNGNNRSGGNGANSGSNPNCVQFYSNLNNGGFANSDSCDYSNSQKEMLSNATFTNFHHNKKTVGKIVNPDIEKKDDILFYARSNCGAGSSGPQKISGQQNLNKTTLLNTKVTENLTGKLKAASSQKNGNLSKRANCDKKENNVQNNGGSSTIPTSNLNQNQEPNFLYNFSSIPTTVTPSQANNINIDDENVNLDDKIMKYKVNKKYDNQIKRLDTLKKKSYREIPNSNEKQTMMVTKISGSDFNSSRLDKRSKLKDITLINQNVKKPFNLNNTQFFENSNTSTKKLDLAHIKYNVSNTNGSYGTIEVNTGNGSGNGNGGKQLIHQNSKRTNSPNIKKKSDDLVVNENYNSSKNIDVYLIKKIEEGHFSAPNPQTKQFKENNHATGGYFNHYLNKTGNLNGNHQSTIKVHSKEFMQSSNHNIQQQIHQQFQQQQPMSSKRNNTKSNELAVNCINNITSVSANTIKHNKKLIFGTNNTIKESSPRDSVRNSQNLSQTYNKRHQDSINRPVYNINSPQLIKQSPKRKNSGFSMVSRSNSPKVKQQMNYLGSYEKKIGRRKGDMNSENELLAIVTSQTKERRSNDNSSCDKIVVNRFNNYFNSLANNSLSSTNQNVASSPKRAGIKHNVTNGYNQGSLHFDKSDNQGSSQGLSQKLKKQQDPLQKHSKNSTLENFRSFENYFENNPNLSKQYMNNMLASSTGITINKSDMAHTITDSKPFKKGELSTEDMESLQKELLDVIYFRYKKID